VQLQTNGKLKHKCGTTATEMVEFAQQCDRNVPDTLGQNRGGMRRRRKMGVGEWHLDRIYSELLAYFPYINNKIITTNRELGTKCY